MPTRLLMLVSATVMGIFGLLLLFLPQEFISLFDITNGASVPIFLQLLGALYVAFAMINWTARGSIVGGIYGRPITAGNFTHFFLGTLLFLKEMRFAPIPIWLLAGMFLYTVFAVFFGRLLFVQPGNEGQSRPT